MISVISEAPPRVRAAEDLMDGFARATGLVGDAPPRRYLWTDAFAVGNFLGLHRLSGPLPGGRAGRPTIPWVPGAS